jgi:ubiquinone/menaquinone biosynthesis C-methylase UbiE
MPGPSAQDRRVQREFTRQASSFAASATLGGEALTAAVIRCLGDAGRGRVLDLAAGPGLVAGALAKAAREVVALDLTAETLRVARQRMHEGGHENVRLVRGNGQSVPFRPGSFDAAVIRLALHHLETPRAAVREAHRCLRPGGLIAVLDLVAPERAQDQAILTALERLRDPSHVRALGESELALVVTGAGFELKEQQSFALERRFSEWAAIIADRVRMDALEVVMRELARQGVRAGVALRDEDGELRFDYRFCLVVGRRG